MATERTRLTRSTQLPPPAASAAAARRNRLAKFAVGGTLAAALVVGVTTLAWTSPRATRATAATKAAAAVPLMNGSEPWSCGATPYEAGYVKLANKVDDHYYYWFVESSSGDPSKDPLVLWLTGGAGGSSLSALLTENGPCTVNADGRTTRPNPYSWTQQANYIWLDQPTGVGFSYSTAIEQDADVDNLPVRIGENIYWFLQGFLAKHPEFDGRAFFITGESYAGHYIPSAGHFILQENAKQLAGRKHINLQGVSIGNGLVDPITQYAHIVDMAVENSYNITTLTDAQIAQMRIDTPPCLAATAQCQRTPQNGSACADALACFGDKLIGPFSLSKRNSYDVRKSCTQTTTIGGLTVCGLDYSVVQTYLSQPAVLAALRVAPEADDWVIIRPDVAMRFERAGDFAFSYTAMLGELLDAGVRVLVYNGDADLVCNWKGGEAWTRALAWKGQTGFNAAQERAFVTAAGAAAGVVRAFDNFTFLRVFNSGHMVPTDQPAVALEMINRFFNNEPL